MLSTRTSSFDYSYYRKVFTHTPMPFAVLDLDLLDENIRNILALRGDKRIRIASKSVRSVEVLRRILNTDNAAFSGIMAFTGREALFLSQRGFRDILIGYPIWEPSVIRDIGKAIDDGSQITLMVDSLTHVRHINAIGQQLGVVFPICLDVDMSTSFPGLHFGVWRSPVHNIQEAKPVVDEALRLSHVRLAGVMGYEAQIAGVGDNYRGQTVKNSIVRQLKRRSLKTIAMRRREVVEYIHECHPDLEFVNGGGTGSLKTTRQESLVTEITVGSGFYSPSLFDNYTDFNYQPALLYAIEVVRKPRADMVTCSGGGYVASGAANKDKLPTPYLPKGLALIDLEGAGEVQTPFRVPPDCDLSLGDPVLMRHSKAGELCERFNELYCVQNGSIVDVIRTYRGEGQCFL